MNAKQLAQRIPAEMAQRAVVRALAAAGRSPEWDSETIEHVLTQLKPCLKALGDVPDPFNSCDDDTAVDFWEEVAES